MRDLKSFVRAAGKMNRTRPLIGITMRHELETERFYLARFYGEAVEAAGGIPLHISLIPKREYVRALVERLDGVLLPGSASDVDPSRYGRDPLPGLGAVHPLKDETDVLVLSEIERRGLPLLAICFGMQIWNVERGGTLVQDIQSQLPEALKHEQGPPRERRSHRVRFDAGSLLSGMSGTAEERVNSHHHQAIETVGESLRATAWATDGLVEAIEETRAGRWGVGVQWHPEIDWRGDRLSERLFQDFVAASTEFAKQQATSALSR